MIAYVYPNTFGVKIANGTMKSNLVNNTDELNVYQALFCNTLCAQKIEERLWSALTSMSAIRYNDLSGRKEL